MGIVANNRDQRCIHTWTVGLEIHGLADPGARRRPTDSRTAHISRHPPYKSRCLDGLSHKIYHTPFSRKFAHTVGPSHSFLSPVKKHG